MHTCFLFLCLLFSFPVFAQYRGEPVPDATADSILKSSRRLFPKFYSRFQQIKTEDTLIRQIRFISKNSNGPAFANPGGIIIIDVDFMENPKPAFDDNRLLVVLYHEIGHLHYYQTIPRPQWTPENSEKAAFEYSLLKTKEMADSGDCGPLKTGVRFMKLRSESNLLQDPHVRALKRMVNEPLYARYVQYVADHCP